MVRHGVEQGPPLSALRGRPAWILAALGAVRIAIPLAALAAHGHKLPGLPRYDYDPRPGDAYGYYSAVRELLATWRQPLVLGLAVVIVAAAAAAAVVLRRRGRTAYALLVLAFGLSLVGALLALRMRPPGAPTIGWSLVWSVPLLPYRALGLPLSPNIAFGVGLALSLASNLITLVATALVGVRATGRTAVALGAAALYAFWPFISGLIGGHRAWGNGTWNVDVGLHLYTEPLSTALVVSAIAICLAPQMTDVGLVAAGGLLSFASVVRLSNAVIAAAVLVVIAVRVGARRAVLFMLALASFAAIEAAYWFKGYLHLAAHESGLPDHPFGWKYARIAWTDSLLWRPHVVLLILPLAALGTLAVLAAWRRVLLWLPVLANAAFYTVYAVTNIHPRFMYVVLPLVLVLWCAGLAVVGGAGRRVVAKGS